MWLSKHCTCTSNGVFCIESGSSDSDILYSRLHGERSSHSCHNERTAIEWEWVKAIKHEREGESNLPHSILYSHYDYINSFTKYTKCIFQMRWTAKMSVRHLTSSWDAVREKNLKLISFQSNAFSRSSTYSFCPQFFSHLCCIVHLIEENKCRKIVVIEVNSWRDCANWTFNANFNGLSKWLQI